MAQRGNCMESIWRKENEFGADCQGEQGHMCTIIDTFCSAVYIALRQGSPECFTQEQESASIKSGNNVD